MSVVTQRERYHRDDSNGVARSVLLTSCIAAHDVRVLQLAKEHRGLAGGLVVGATQGHADAGDLAQSKSQLADLALLLGRSGGDSIVNLRYR